MTHAHRCEWCHGHNGTCGKKDCQFKLYHGYCSKHCKGGAPEYKEAFSFPRDGSTFLFRFLTGSSFLPKLVARQQRLKHEDENDPGFFVPRRDDVPGEFSIFDSDRAGVVSNRLKETYLP